ncbi:MAG: uroporphyrinogen decarboxylase [Rhodospirillaceae bacterium]|nr:uroporphyrinogen decarboxylase [Rhodospirillaceae bacterium]|tara:strand:+ start:1358 stop:2389 length:1032 start_codon:yes stop_codon:yes gene_type:complete
MAKAFLEVLNGERRDPPPIWLMRQAGRYLPEYRELRAKAGGFLDLCYTPDFAVEVTIQPIERYGFDAAILFSDILVVPDGLGQDVSFVEGTGPVLEPVRDAEAVSRLSIDGVLAKLAPVYETVATLRQRLGPDTALIGFAGAPWTVACYMIEGRTSRDFHNIKSFCYRDPELFGQLMDLLVEATIAHLSAQAEAGAEALQIFESHAGVLPEEEFRTWVLEPIKRIVSALRARWPDLPIIGFPRGAGAMYVPFAAETGVSAVSLDTTVSLSWADANLPAGMPIQGNLDPVYLLTGGDAMDAAVDRIVGACVNRPHIFNLGHGVDKQTSPDTVSRLVDCIRNKTA